MEEQAVKQKFHSRLEAAHHSFLCKILLESGSWDETEVTQFPQNPLGKETNVAEEDVCPKYARWTEMIGLDLQ